MESELPSIADFASDGVDPAHYARLADDWARQGCKLYRGRCGCRAGRGDPTRGQSGRVPIRRRRGDCGRPANFRSISVSGLSRWRRCAPKISMHLSPSAISATAIQSDSFWATELSRPTIGSNTTPGGVSHPQRGTFLVSKACRAGGGRLLRATERCCA